MNLEDGRCVRYYMRIIQADGYGVEEKLEFVRNFNAATFSDGWPGEFGKNLEPKSDADNTTLSRVTINNTASQIGWAGLEVEQITEPVFTIREISEETASITVEYLVNYIRQGRETYASVEEVYRVRQGTDRMYLLDYERQMSEIFAEDNSAFVGDKIVLGITDPHVEMMESDGGKILAFAQAGVLYSVNVTDNRLSKLFPFTILREGMKGPSTAGMILKSFRWMKREMYFYGIRLYQPGPQGRLYRRGNLSVQ